VHEAALFGSTPELLDVVVPHLRAASAAGEPAVGVLTPTTAALVVAAVGHLPGVALEPADLRERPAVALTRYQSLVADYLAAGARQVRVVAEVPHPGLGACWQEWARYEAAVNAVLAPYPVWGVCLYDVRITPPPVLTDVARTHPFVFDHGEHRPNGRFEDPVAFLASPPPGGADPLEAGPPAVELGGPSPAAARRAIRDVASRSGLSTNCADDAVLATSEVVTNALIHGEPPVTMRVWAAPGRLVVAVTDRGAGPRDPFAGLLRKPSETGAGGIGLWLAHRLVQVTHDAGADAFTVRLVIDDPDPASPAGRDGEGRQD
jgi:anti-sigma regulatory factor (Ser/Thr protein kinase)